MEECTPRVRRVLIGWPDVLADSRPSREETVSMATPSSQASVPTGSYAARLEQIAHLHVPETEAEQLWRHVSRHRRELLRRLGPDVAPRVPLLDDLIRKHLRGADVPCRLGGDEFAIILSDTAQAEAGTVAERFRADVEAWFETHPVCGQFLEVTVSGGIATAPSDAAGQDQLYALAERALYEAKRRGSNRIVATAGLAPPGTPAAVRRRADARSGPPAPATRDCVAPVLTRSAP